MKTNVFLVASLLLALFSCTSKQEQKEVPVQSLKHDVLMGEECVIGLCRELAILDDSTLVVLNTKSDKQFQILNLAQKEIVEFGDRGQGPNEFLLPFSLFTKGNTFSFYDSGKNRYSTIHLNKDDDSWRIEHLFKSDSLTHVYIQPIQGNRYVASGIYDDCKLVLLDEHGTFLKGFGEIPYQDEMEKEIRNVVRSQVYQGNIVVSPSGKKVAHVIFTGDLIYFYEVTSEGGLVLRGKQENAYAKYEPTYGAMMPESPFYHYGSCATEDYVYTLYSGRNMKDYGEKAFKSNLIHVYDWDGTLVKKLQLDIDINKMVITKDNRKIYAIADLPDPVLVIFELE